MRLNDMSKDALIEVMRRVNDGKVGDTGRTSKAEYIKMLTSDFETEKVVSAIDEVEQALAGSGLSRPVSLLATRPAPAPSNQDAARQLADALAALMPTQQAQAAPVDADMVREIIREELQGVAPRRLQIEIGDSVQVVGEHPHPMLEKVLRLAQAGLNVLLVGGAGSGKTHLAEQVAAILGRDYGSISCTAGASESELLGWLMPVGEGGRFEYAPAQFITLYENGNSLFLFDELDAADPNMLLAVNTALSNGKLHVPRRFNNPTVTRGQNQIVMATANTHGTGADMIYNGRSALDGATLDRFYVVNVDYNLSLEASIMGVNVIDGSPVWKAATPDTLQDDMVKLYETIKAVRDMAASNKLRRIISTRAFQKAAAARRAGVPVDEIILDLLAGWSRDELSKVGLKHA